MRNQRLFVTGGAGYLGRGLLKKAITEEWASHITVYSRDETKQDEMASWFRRIPAKRRGGVTLQMVIGDVRDREHMQTAMVGHGIVVHAGAMKYIPEAEDNVDQAMAVNIDGSRNVAKAARAAGIRVCVGISTDKAVEPLNTYGATKFLMERYFGEADRRSTDTRFVTCRYGNVVGSTGSVIPKFLESIAAGRITLTDGRMTRFWLPVDQAVRLVEDAVADAEIFGGGVFVDACPSMTMQHLVLACILAAPGDRTIDDVDVEIIGIRPGEKMHESLLGASEAAQRTFNWRDHGYVVLAPFDPKITELEAAGFIRALPNAYTSAQPRRKLSPAKMAEWIAQ